MSVNCHVNQNWGIPTPKWAIYIRLFEFGLSNGGYKRMLCLVSVLWKKLPNQWIDTLEMILFPFKKQIRLRMGKFNYLILWFLIPDFSCPETWSHCLHKGRCFCRPNFPITASESTEPKQFWSIFHCAKLRILKDFSLREIKIFFLAFFEWTNWQFRPSLRTCKKIFRCILVSI